MRKRKTKYSSIDEIQSPRLVSNVDVSNNKRFYDRLFKVVAQTLNSKDIFIFKEIHDCLINTDDNTWVYKTKDNHPLVRSYNGGGFSYVEKIQDNIQIVRDVRLGEKVDYRNDEIWTYSFRSHLLIVIVNKTNNTSDFQKSFFENLSDYVDLEIPPSSFSRDDYLENISSLIIQTISKKDSYTGGHTKRVGMFAEMICDELNCDESFRKEVSISAVIHDVGKIGIPDHILKKNSPLTEQEYDIMKEHPSIGGDILKKVPGFENISKGVRFHHERPDGKGYPYGIKGDDIPLIAKIVSLSDAFDAMISTRPYRQAISPYEAFEILKSFKGTQFDVEVFDAFEKAFLNSNISKKYRELKKVG